jgi:hypothetical protein
MGRKMTGLDIRPSKMSARQIRKAVPLGGIVMLAVEHDKGLDSDIVPLNPKWIAMLLKRIRKGGPETISLRGCLLPNSPELNGAKDYLQDATGITSADWQEWLLDKPEQEYFESATVCEGGLTI